MPTCPEETTDTSVVVFGMGGTIDKDYPRSTNGYAFEIDKPSAQRILTNMPHLGITYKVQSVRRKDSTEIDDNDRLALVESIAASSAKRIVVTHGTDTMIETALFVLRSGCVKDKKMAFTGAMKPERFKDSDADFNLGTALGATSFIAEGSVVVCMGGNVILCQNCVRCLETGLFLNCNSDGGHPACVAAVDD